MTDLDPQCSTDVTCISCYNEFPMTEYVPCRECKKGYCFDCINGVITARIEIDDKIVLTCCQTPLDTAAVVRALDPCTSNYDIVIKRIYTSRFHDNLRYCSNPVCSTPFDWIEDKTLKCSSQETPMIICPLCGTKSCASCRTVWHDDTGCKEVQGRKNEADNYSILEKDGTNFEQCPRCCQMVERHAGCSMMPCRCGCHFCIECGEEGCIKEDCINLLI